MMDQRWVVRFLYGLFRDVQPWRTKLWLLVKVITQDVNTTKDSGKK